MLFSRIVSYATCNNVIKAVQSLHALSSELFILFAFEWRHRPYQFFLHKTDYIASQIRSSTVSKGIAALSRTILFKERRIGSYAQLGPQVAFISSFENDSVIVFAMLSVIIASSTYSIILGLQNLL